jgi:putative acetyltransferase
MPSAPPIVIRRELPEDVEAVRAVVAGAFADQAPPDAPAGSLPVEVMLLDALRATDEWLPALSMVAEVDGEVIGYVVCSRAWVDPHPVLGLGPLAVTPKSQGSGVGSALMHAVLGAADALDEPLVVLLGHTGYYPRFGFRAAGKSPTTFVTGTKRWPSRRRSEPDLRLLSREPCSAHVRAAVFQPLKRH